VALDLLTIADFAAETKVSRRTVERWISEGKLAVVLLNGTRTAGSVRIKRSEAERFKRRRAVRFAKKAAIDAAVAVLLFLAVTAVLAAASWDPAERVMTRLHVGWWPGIDHRDHDPHGIEPRGGDHDLDNAYTLVRA